MANVLSVGIDLGRDTLKLSYAYLRKGGDEVAYGKIENNESVRHVAIPAVAYYDNSAGWIFADNVDKGGEKPFINVVKIKTLLSLLYPKGKGRTEKYPDKDYYYKENWFPKFFFPTRQKNLTDFGKIIEGDGAFRAEGTPQKVCEDFFFYVKTVVDEGIAAVESAVKIKFDTVKYAIVHPSNVGKLYVEELIALVKKAFGKAPSRVMNNGRALSMFAKERGAVKSDDEILIFDMGEDTISVLKCFLNDDGKVVVEPAADHSPPAEIGGNDVDFSIADYIENSILKRETVGSPSYGETGHIYEEGLQAKQYLFLKEIKKAKLLLSIPSLAKIFKNGVPVSLHRDLYIQMTLTHKQLEESVGISTDDGIAREILDYILDELKREVNSDVKSIFLTGGLVETCGLTDYIRKGLRKNAPTVVVRTFDDNVDNGNNLIIQTYEDSVYAPSVGAAIVALRGYDVSAGLTYSYGTWMSINGNKILAILVGRGHMFDEHAAQKLFTGCNLQGTLPEEFFSVRLSKSSIQKRKFEGKGVSYLSSKGENYLCIGEPNSETRRQAEKRFQLKALTDKNATIVCEYRGRPIVNCDPRLPIIEGVMSKPDSNVMIPFVEKQKGPNRRIFVKFRDGTSAFVMEKDIEVRLSGISSFVGETD